MKKFEKYFVEIVLAIVLILDGAINLLLPFIGYGNIRVILGFTFGIIALVNLIGFIKKPKDKDYEHLFSCIASIVICVLSLFLPRRPSNLALVLLLYVMIMSLIRLKKADFYHDRKNKIWRINIITLGLFILTGILTSLNLYYQSEVQVLMFGYFFLMNGILELIDPLVLYLKEN